MLTQLGARLRRGLRHGRRGLGRFSRFHGRRREIRQGKGRRGLGHLGSMLGGQGCLGGLLCGNQVGGGKGNTLATVAGAVGGGYAGNRIEASRQHAQVTSSVQRKCSTVNNTNDKIVGYDVKYVYNGVTRTVRMDHDPGDRVQVQEGVTAVSDAR